MKQKVMRKETAREAGEAAGKEIQGGLTDSVLLKETSESKPSFH